MKKILLLFTFMVCYLSSAQDRVEIDSSSNELLKNVSFFRSPAGTHNHDKYVQFEWDFTSLKSNVTLYITPLKDCFNGIEGIKEFNKIEIKIDGTNYQLKDTLKLFHVEMNAKCFKWKIVSSDTKNIEDVDWMFYSFVE